MRHHRHVPRCHQAAGARRCQRRWVTRDHRFTGYPSSRRTLDETGGGSAPKPQVTFDGPGGTRDAQVPLSEFSRSTPIWRMRTATPLPCPD
jgi:hypothetical protein